MKNLLRNAAHLYHDKIAYAVGDESITYAELWDSASSAADFLVRQGTEPVILFGRRECFMVVHMVACLIAGRAYVPIEPSLPQIRLNNIIKASGASLIIGEEKPNFISNIPFCFPNELTKFDSLPKKSSSNETAYIIFTSGTTGEPKGVPISVTNLQNFTRWICSLNPLSLYRNVAVLNQASFSFDLSVADMYYSLTCGHTLVSLCSNEPSEIAEVFSKNRIAVCAVTPTFIKLCMTDPDFCAGHFPSLRCVYFCGEILEPKTVQRLWERFPNLEIINAYGPTEATSAVSAVRISGEMLDEPYLPVGDIGNLATDVKIEDGEIVLRGDSVFSGYLNGEIGGYFRQNGQNCYKTGDIGEIRNGYLYCRGRTDSQIKYKGYRIELADIEANISRMEGVSECAVTVSRSSDGTVRYIIANVVGENLENLRDRLGACLPSYMLPKVIRVLDSLPMNDNGKTDRKALCDGNFRNFEDSV